jgi:hypothetical protein
MITDAIWVLPNPVGRHTRVFYNIHFNAIEYWYYRNYGYYGYINGLTNGLVIGYKPDDAGTLILGITFYRRTN